MHLSCRCLNCIMPPHILRKLLESKDKDVRQNALNTLASTALLRGQRAALAGFAATASGEGRRTIFDCRNGTDFSAAVMVRSEDGLASSDDSANRAFDGLGTTRDFYRQVLDRTSIDGRGMRLDGYVHFDRAYNNAFWDGRRMVFGDGDDSMFTDFTRSLDVIAHELTHGVTEFTAGLEYHNQPGALNESISDVFGSLVKQWFHQHTAGEADWLIGSDIFTPGIDADALRSMKEPGKAYDNELFGKDPQPDHMSRYENLPDNFFGDFGGVHINSGIPNKAFYLTAIDIGGYAWEAPGHIWYEALKASNVRTQFQEFAELTYAKAGELYGAAEQQSVLTAWREVGIRISVPLAASAAARARAATGREADTLAALTKQIEGLATQMKVLVKDVAALKGKK
jgi:Zn-dependent metalloprotease